jgi:hypothetical protein
VNDDLACEVSAAIALAGWQGLADRPDLVERLMPSVPDMDPEVAVTVRAIYRAQQTGRRVMATTLWPTANQE